MVLRDPGLGVKAPVGKLLVRVWLLLAFTVHEELATPDGDPVPRQPDDPLYQVLVGVIDALEDYDISAPGFREAVDELIHEHPVADLERGDHAARGDLECLHDEWPDEAEDQREGYEQYDQVLERASTLLGGPPTLFAGGLELLIVVVRLLGHEVVGYRTWTDMTKKSPFLKYAERLAEEAEGHNHHEHAEADPHHVRRQPVPDAYSERSADHGADNER